MSFKYNPLSDNLDKVNSKASEIKTDNGKTLEEALQNIGSPFQFQGEIGASGDFPTSDDVQNGWTYTITADVIDNDSSKTNTGDSFLKGDIITWNGNDWTNITGQEIFIEDSNEIKAISDKDINLQSSGLKDNNITTAIKLGDSNNTSLNTSNTTILGGINEVKDIVDTKVNKLSWAYLKDTWSSEPTFNSNNGDGDIYNYTLDGITRYRFIPTNYDPTEDAFYEEVELTTLITKRG